MTDEGLAKPDRRPAEGIDQRGGIYGIQPGHTLCQPHGISTGSSGRHEKSTGDGRPAGRGQHQ